MAPLLWDLICITFIYFREFPLDFYTTHQMPLNSTGLSLHSLPQLHLPSQQMLIFFILIYLDYCQIKRRYWLLPMSGRRATIGTHWLICFNLITSCISCLFFTMTKLPNTAMKGGKVYFGLGFQKRQTAHNLVPLSLGLWGGKILWWKDMKHRGPHCVSGKQRKWAGARATPPSDRLPPQALPSTLLHSPSICQASI